MLSELEYRGAAYWDVYPRYYIASIGGHLFNVHSLNRQVLFTAGIPYDTRIHLFLVTFPGFGKSFWLFQFLMSDVGLIGSTRIPTTFEGYMTEAGWVGTKKFATQKAKSKEEDMEDVNTIYGVASEYATGIVGCEEFAALSNAMQQTYNRQFDTALLTSLDSGFVNKRLAAGSIKYKTSVTLWSGTQPARFDLAGGIGRRLTFMHLIPTDEDIEIMRRARRSGFGKRLNTAKTDAIRSHIDKRKDEVSVITDVKMTKSIYDEIDKYKMMPFEEPIYERIALGYSIMKGNFNGLLEIKMDKDLAAMFKQEYIWRLEIKKGSEQSQILGYIRSCKDMSIGIGELRSYLYNLGYGIEEGEKVIGGLSRLKGITIDDEGVVRIPHNKRSVE